MSLAIREYLPWVMSAVTLWMTWLAGDKHPNAWAVGLANQVLWSVWIVAMGAWGLLPMNIGMWLLYGRNHLKWQVHESAQTRGSSSSRKPVTLKDPQAEGPVEAVSREPATPRDLAKET
jgi:hypothetical protein